MLVALGGTDLEGLITMFSLLRKDNILQVDQGRITSLFSSERQVSEPLELVHPQWLTESKCFKLAIRHVLRCFDQHASRDKNWNLLQIQRLFVLVKLVMRRTRASGTRAYA